MNKTKTLYCCPCGDDREFVLKMHEQEIEILGEKINLMAPVWQCPKCAVMQPYIEGSVDAISLAKDIRNAK